MEHMEGDIPTPTYPHPPLPLPTPTHPYPYLPPPTPTLPTPTTNDGLEANS